MKIWLVILLAIPVVSWGEPLVPGNQDLEIEGWQAPTANDPNNVPINWVDTSHAYATNQTQALTQWMDNFFGDPNYDIEKAESLVRLEWVNDWDQEDNYNTKLRLRGKLQLPKVSKRLNLVFSGEDGDELSEDERQNDDQVGLLYNVAERQRSRVDLTLGITSSDVRPGIRFRNQGPITDLYGYRYTQRLQYETDEGFYTTGQVNLDRSMGESKLIRWSNRIVYGEETDGAEWRTRLSYNQRVRPAHKKHQLVISYFGSINGVSDPSYTKNYRLGMLFRRQVYRQFLFMELEPSYNFRRRKIEEQRDGAWNIVIRFEVALQRDLRRITAPEDP
ncbi:MAG: hypothetical protein V7700_05155 [Halioglobus sp.]